MKDALGRIQELNRAYGILFEEDVSSLKEGRRLPRKGRVREKERIVNEVMNELAQLKALIQQSIIRKIERLDEAGSKARAVAMVITVIALLFGIALSIRITRSITQPLSLVKNKTREIAKGTFEADLSYLFSTGDRRVGRCLQFHVHETQGSGQDEVRFLFSHVS